MLSLALLVGGVINSLRYEVHDTGELPYAKAGAPHRRLGSTAEVTAHRRRLCC